jgi:transforming growth factor-beta-induced protein
MQAVAKDLSWFSRAASKQPSTTHKENSMKHIIATLALTLFTVGAHAEAKLDIVDTAVSAGKFNTLVAAVGAAGLESTLRSEGPFTVFAPTDDAFAALPAGTVEALLGDIPALQNILLYHVSVGRLSASDLIAQGRVTTVQGQKVMVNKMGQDLFINGAKVLISEIAASNGTIYVIDAVLLPSAK